jgi:hypothetical protein
MGNGSGVSRGGRNRNVRLERLRALVPMTNAIAGIGLAGKMQMVAVTDHDSKVMARGRSGAGPGMLARCWTGRPGAPGRKDGLG